MTTAVIAACLPALKPLAVKWFPRFFAEDNCEQSPSWLSQDLGPPLPNVSSNLSRAFNSLFSRWDPREGQNPPNFFGIRHGKIVQLNSRFSRLSLGPLLSNQDEGSWDWEQSLKENKWPLPPAETLDNQSVRGSIYSQYGGGMYEHVLWWNLLWNVLNLALF